jgi:mevalonate pyrophosphate decarboxylase
MNEPKWNSYYVIADTNNDTCTSIHFTTNTGSNFKLIFTAKETRQLIRILLKTLWYHHFPKKDRELN